MEYKVYEILSREGKAILVGDFHDQLAAELYAQHARIAVDTKKRYYIGPLVMVKGEILFVSSSNADIGMR